MNNNTTIAGRCNYHLYGVNHPVMEFLLSRVRLNPSLLTCSLGEVGRITVAELDGVAVAPSEAPKSKSCPRRSQKISVGVKG